MKITTFDDVPDIMTINDEELTTIVGGCGKRNKCGGGGGCASACASGQVQAPPQQTAGPVAPSPSPISVEASYSYGGQTTTSQS
jgi:hypothetical protein